MILKTCRTCGEKKPFESYYLGNKSTGCRVLDCPQCHAMKGAMRRKAKYSDEQIRERQRAYNSRRKPEDKFKNYLRSRYGLPVEGYDALLDAQGHACAICETQLTDLTGEGRRGLHVDHCHDSGQVRGLLCSACNRSIGALGDSPERLRRAADYVESRGIPVAREHPEWRAPYGFQNTPSGPRRRSA